jgi:hypothetical protein
MENLMTQSSLARLRLGRIVLLGASAFALGVSPFAVGEAAARVGVTSATDGDPLGKPPQEAERVLRIGIDVQANELITTNANDRAHLLFLDGSSLTVGPNAQLTIDKFVFDPNTKTGELSINATKGVLRMVGGKISKNTPINITTPSSTIGIRGGITIMDVSAAKTDSTFVFGKDMTVRGAGQTQVATRPGSLIVTSLGSPPGQPTLLPQGGLTAQLGALEGRRAAQGSSGGASTGGGSGRNPDQVAQTSGLSGVNSSQSVRIVAPGVPDNFGSGPGPRNRNPNDTIVNAVSTTNPSNAPDIAPTTTAPTQQQQQTATPVPTPLPPPPTTVPPVGQAPGGQQPTGVPPSGSQPVVTNLPQTGIATYVGGMVGIVNGHSISTGSYQNAWNFGTNQGTVSATFQGAKFQGSTVGGTRGTFSTPAPIASANINGRQLELNGTFFGSGSQPGFQIGNFKITGNGNYRAHGLFAGEKGR